MPSFFNRKMKIKKKTNNTIKSQLIVITSPCLQGRGDSRTRPAPKEQQFLVQLPTYLRTNIKERPARFVFA
jgi:hypothetical protein